MLSRLSTFIDRHPLTAVPGAVRQQIHLEAVHGLTDVSGTRPLGHWVEDGVIYCVLAAPSQQAVCRHHAERGLPCDDLHPVEGLRTTRPFSAEDEARVRMAIAHLWHMHDSATVGPQPDEA